MRTGRMRWALLGVFGISLASVIGCQDPLTYEHFSQIYENRSSQAEVARLIGEPSERLDSQWLYERPGKHLTAILDFDTGGIVSRKQWIDAMNAVWEDTADDGDLDADHRESTRIEKGVE